MIVRIKASEAKPGMKVYPRQEASEYNDLPAVIQSVSKGVIGNAHLLKGRNGPDDTCTLVFYEGRGWAVYSYDAGLWVEVDFIDHSVKESVDEDPTVQG